MDGSSAFIGGLMFLCAGAVVVGAYNLGALNAETRVFADCRRDGFTWHWQDKWECHKVPQPESRP